MEGMGPMQDQLTLRVTHYFVLFVAMSMLLLGCGESAGSNGGARGACEEFCDLQQACSLVGVTDCDKNCEDVEVDRPPCEDALDDLIDCLEDDVCNGGGAVGVHCGAEQQRATDRCDGDYHLVP